MERLNISGITLEGYAEGGIRTSIGVPEIKSLFDVGHPISTSLRYGNIFITHGHMDHCGSLTNVLARRGLNKMKDAQIYLHKGLKTHFEELFDVWKKINGGKKYRLPGHLNGMTIGSHLPLKNGYSVEGLKTYHSVTSIGWGVSRRTKKLKDEYVGLSGQEIGKLKREGHDITYDTDTKVLCIPGDTTIDFLINCKFAQEAKILVHEVTYWDDELSSVQECKMYGHTHYRSMIEHCEKFQGEHLVLCHRSMKYSRKFAENVIKTQFPASMKDKIILFDNPNH